MSDTKLIRAMEIVDRAQATFFREHVSTDREEISAWFNACLNSACGPVAERFGHEAVMAMLLLWVDTAAAKAKQNDANPTRPHR